MVKLVVSDLDGTLIDSSEQLTDTAREMARWLKDRNVLFTFATGRVQGMTERYAQDMQVSIPYVATNGAALIAPDGVLFRRKVPLKPLETMLRKADCMGMSIIYSEDGYEKVCRETPYILRQRAAFGRYNDVAPLTQADYDGKQMEKVYKVQWQLGRIFSEYAFSSNILAKEAIRAKSLEVMMENKVQWQKILVDSLNNSDKSQQQVINDVISQVGECLNSDVAAVYVRDDDGSLDCQYLWSKNQSMSAEEYVSDWQRGNIRFRSWQNGQGKVQMADKGYMVIDARHIDDVAKKILTGSTVKSFVAVTVYVNGRSGAVFVLANTSVNKIWSVEEIEFAKQTSEVIRCCLEKIESDDSVKRINSVLLDTYNYMDEGIFIREVDTGKVLFSNKALNDMLGYDFTDKDSKLLIENLRDKYKIMGGPDQHIGVEEKEVNWRSYIRSLDKIMDLTEVRMKWLDGSNASLVILRDVNE